MKKVTFLAIIFILCSLIPSTSRGAKRALLVGINDYRNLPARITGRGEFYDLRGSVNDVRIINDILISKYGFSADEIRILTEKKASRTNIKRVFNEWLVSTSKPGDLVLFFFSGHGSHVPDQNGDENDGMDEVLCPYDFVIHGGKNIILDDELGMWMRRLKGRDVVVIIDSCHSGTMTRSIGRKEVSVLEDTPLTRKKLVPIIDYQPSHTRGKGLPPVEDEPEGQIFMAAAREYQIALEINSFGKYHGGFTYSMVDGLKKLHNVTYLGLYEYVTEMVKDRLKLDQDPQIEPSSKEILDWPVFNPRPIIIAQAATTTSIKPSSPLQVFTSTSTIPIQQTTSVTAPMVTTSITAMAITTTTTTMPIVSTSTSTTITTAFPELPSDYEMKKERLLVAIDPFEGSNHSTMELINSELRKIPYVEVVDKDDFFNRLIRGEMVDGEISARILNGIGDVVKLKSTGNIKELINSIAPYLEYAYVEKQLAYVTNPNPPFKVKVWVTDQERRDFRIGEKVIFNFWSERGCYLLMLNLDSKGNFHIIFPNQYHQNNFMPSGGSVEIPDEQMKRENFEFMFDLPAGEETVKVIATSKRIDIRNLGLEQFEDLFQAVQGSASTQSSPSRNLVKDIIISLRDSDFEWSEDTFVLRTHE